VTGEDCGLSSSVIAGLDLPGFNPGTNPSASQRVLAKKMDPRVKPAGDGEGWQPVIAGLDPAIHPLTKNALEERWTPLVKPAGDERAEWISGSISSPIVGAARCTSASPMIWCVGPLRHREGLVPGFTKRYGIKMLVYYERHDTAAAAIQREKKIKHWPREWKIDLILSMNPDWRDLYDEIAQ
jgi:putative endonuclease